MKAMARMGRPPQDEFMWKLRWSRTNGKNVTWYSCNSLAVHEKIRQIEDSPECKLEFIGKYQLIEETAA